MGKPPRRRKLAGGDALPDGLQSADIVPTQRPGVAAADGMRAYALGMSKLERIRQRLRGHSVALVHALDMWMPLLGAHPKVWADFRDDQVIVYVVADGWLNVFRAPVDQLPQPATEIPSPDCPSSARYTATRITRWDTVEYEITARARRNPAREPVIHAPVQSWTFRIGSENFTLRCDPRGDKDDPTSFAHHLIALLRATRDG